MQIDTEPMLPNLKDLTMFPRQPLVRNKGSDSQRVESAIYCLDKNFQLPIPCVSSVLLCRGALPANKVEFDDLANFMKGVPQQMFMGNPVPRKQCTFGPFKYKTYPLYPNDWPSLVTRVLDATRAFADQLGVDKPEEYTGVHVNFYPDGDSSVSKHADDERQLVTGAPIFSYTYLEGNDNSLARDFKIWRRPDLKDDSIVEGSGMPVSLRLESGDLLVMMGQMQTFFVHGVEKVRNAPVAPRLNLTVRKFVDLTKRTREREE